MPLRCAYDHAFAVADSTPDSLTRLYRFALLLQGNPDAAESAVAKAYESGSHDVAQLRNDRGRMAFLASRVRERCLDVPAPAAGRESAPDMVRHFAELPEPGRSGLAMLYTDLLPAHEIAVVLGVSLEQLGSALGMAREQLRAAEMEGETRETIA